MPTNVPLTEGLQRQLLDVFLFLGSEWILYVLLFLSIPGASARRSAAADVPDMAMRLVNAPLATCTNSHNADGVPLDQCYGQTFTIGANTRSVSIYYTLNTTHNDTAHTDPGVTQRQSCSTSGQT